VLVTHDPAVGNRARRIVRMRDGRIESDTPNTPPAADATDGAGGAA
jgi:ABC-type lipoprotein export system ATPase subunit